MIYDLHLCRALHAPLAEEFKALFIRMMAKQGVAQHWIRCNFCPECGLQRPNHAPLCEVIGVERPEDLEAGMLS